MVGHSNISYVKDVSVTVKKTDRGNRILFNKNTSDGTSLKFASLLLSDSQIEQLKKQLGEM